MEHAIGQQQADRHACLNPARMEAAPPLVAVLHGHQHRAAPLAADTESLHETQCHQQDGRGDADLLIGRQQADQHRRHTHDHEGGDEHGLAPDLVAKVPENDAAKRAREEADGIGGKGRHRAGRGINRGKK